MFINPQVFPGCMGNINLDELALAILNGTKSPRETLREYIPFVDKIESLDKLTFLKLTDLQINQEMQPNFEDYWIEANYNAIAADGFYPYVRKRLIDMGITKKHNIQTKTHDKKLRDMAYESLHLTFLGDRLQIYLRVYNPSYSGLLQKHGFKF
jgi:hypothetical protein